MFTGVKCPHCNEPMRLLGGYIYFTYWVCKDCKKEFEYNGDIEKITAEAPAQEKILEILNSKENNK